MGGRNRALLERSRPTGLGLASVVLLVAARGSGLALANPDSPGRASESGAPEKEASPDLVLEFFRGTRPENADGLIGPILSELEARGFAAGPGQTSAIIESRVSRRGATQQISVDELRAAVEHGYGEFLQGEFGAAVNELSRVLAAVHANPAEVVLDDGIQPLLARVVIGLGMSWRRMGREAVAVSTMAELVRSLPHADVSRHDYGPEVVDFVRTVRAQLEAEGTGQLVVETRDPTVALFLNERFRGFGSLDLQVLSGPYRLYVKRGTSEGRVYDVTVEPGRATRLTVDLALDAAIRTGAKWTGLVLPNQPGAEARAVEYAARLGRRAGSRQVVLIGFQVQDRAWHLVGTVVAMTGRRVIRRASLSLRPTPSVAARAGLGRFLAGEDPSEELHVSVQDGRTVTSELTATAKPGGSRRLWAWVAGGAGVAAVAGGVTLILIDEGPVTDGERNFHYRESLWPGVAMTATGAGLLGTSLWLWLSQPDRAPTTEPLAVGLQVEGERWWLVAAGRF